MLSFAQNGEDVVLQRAFGDQPTGFYVDVGACHPIEDSVTLHFYRRGWRGINIEPDRALHALLAAERPGDVNLCMAIARERGRATFFPTSTRGHGTLDAAVAAGRSEGRAAETVPKVPLTDILECYGPEDGTVDFLKVDVEGFEGEVIASLDWNRCRPRVVLIESVDEAGRPTHASWEPMLLDARYRFGLFDGLNRYYCREEDADRLLASLSVPANVLDRWMRARDAEAHAGVAELSAALAEARRMAAEGRHEFEAALEQANRAADEERRRADEARRMAAEGRHEFEAALEQANRATDEERRRADEERRKADAARGENEVLAVETHRCRTQAAAALRRAEAAEAHAATLEMDLLRMRGAQDEWQGRWRDAESGLSAFRNSTFWRATGPMRRAVEFVRRQTR
jgi:FkbM family methyltransferase